MTRHLVRALGSAMLAVWLVMPAQAEKLGSPLIQTYLWGIDDLPPGEAGPGGIAGPGAYGPLLDFANELSLVDGAMVRSVQIGTSTSGDPVFAEVGVEQGGDIFWVQADTARNSVYKGSEAQVRMNQSFRKDAPDAQLTYTYSFAKLSSFFDIEYGTLCKPGTHSYCLQAGFISIVEVWDRATGKDVDAHFQKLLLWSSPVGFDYVVDGSSAWSWEVTERAAGGYSEIVAELSDPATGVLDLSGVEVGQEFDVSYTLWAYAVDTSPDAPGRGRTAQVFVRDPLGGNTGVGFDLVGLTPTNDPLPIPEPGVWAMFLAGLLVIGACRRSRRA